MRVLSLARRLVTTLAVIASVGTVLGLAVVNHMGNKVLVVSSGSMTPTFRAGDAVIVEKPSPAALHPGSIVTFQPPGSMDRLTTHRIHDVVRKPYGVFLRTKGDANLTADPNLVPLGNVRGVLTMRIPHAGRWLAFYESPRGRGAILGLPLLMLLLSQGAAFFRDFGRGGARADARRDHRGTGATSDTLDTDPEVAAPSHQQTRRARRDASSAGSGRRLVTGAVLAACAIGAVVGVGVARRTHALYTGASPVGANALATRKYCPDTTAYKKAVGADLPLLYYRLGETGGTTAANSGAATSSPATYLNFQPSDFGARGALRCDESQPGTAETAVSFDGQDNYVVSSASGSIGKTAPISLEAWFLAPTSSAGGLIVGRCNQNGNRDSDRVLYLTPGGQVAFGLGAASAADTLMTSGRSLADGQWHYAVATVGGSTMQLYLDGSLAASSSYQNANNGQGTWQVGWDDPADLGLWPSAPTASFLGSIDEVAIYGSTLTWDQVKAHWNAAQYQ